MDQTDKDKIKQLINSQNAEQQKVGLHLLYGLVQNIEECVYFYRLCLKPKVSWLDKNNGIWSQKYYCVGDYTIVFRYTREWFRPKMIIKTYLGDGKNLKIKHGIFELDDILPLAEYLKYAIEKTVTDGK